MHRHHPTSMRMSAPRLLAFAVASAVTLAAIASGTITTRAVGDQPTVLRVAATANVGTWDPVRAATTEPLYLNNMYEQLLRKNPPGSPEAFAPLLATSWESSADGLTWTFHLRDGVRFHDGEPLTADAVKASIEADATRGGFSFIWA